MGQRIVGLSQGFDLDISPLVVEHTAKGIWLVHETSAPTDASELESDGRLDRIRDELRSHGLNQKQVEMVLLAHTPEYPLDVLPTPEEERTELVEKSSEFKVMVVDTPRLIDSLWSKIGVAGHPPPHVSACQNPLAEPHQSSLKIHLWSKSLPQHLPLKWAFARFLMNHGEYASTRDLLNEVIDKVTAEGIHDIAAMLTLDLGDVNAIYGNREEAIQAYKKALGFYEEGFTSWQHESRVIDIFYLSRIPEHAYFGIGELSYEFFDLATAAWAFGKMGIDTNIIRALVHYCREEFNETSRLLSDEIAFKPKSQSRFHH
ncbi:MAG: hypothetical protein QNJ97_11090 [Myxococcota bacterium]|nr:hypothetical protein [Myxococcota bacterium]